MEDILTNLTVKCLYKGKVVSIIEGIGDMEGALWRIDFELAMHSATGWKYQIC